MTKDKLERLKASIGEEAANKVADQISDSKEVLEDLGVESKEEDVVVEEVSEEAEEVADEEKEITPDVKELAEAIAKELGLEELSEILKKQGEQIKELAKEEDEKIAEKIEDKSLGARLWRASSDESNVIEKETLLEEEGELADEAFTQDPEIAWIGEVMS